MTTVTGRGGLTTLLACQLALITLPFFSGCFPHLPSGAWPVSVHDYVGTGAYISNEINI